MSHLALRPMFGSRGYIRIVSNRHECIVSHGSMLSHVRGALGSTSVPNFFITPSRTRLKISKLCSSWAKSLERSVSVSIIRGTYLSYQAAMVPVMFWPAMKRPVTKLQISIGSLMSRARLSIKPDLSFAASISSSLSVEERTKACAISRSANLLTGAHARRYLGDCQHPSTIDSGINLPGGCLLANTVSLVSSAMRGMMI